ncbi:ankyrin repeat domain-containing protein 1-like isoform X4 [Amborella trichopoda]|uniref:ankyrin repeat domain-containing protein 1-like isoform X4 n=1 Tax=Amborella trichopoda TaxID=13333 RepID=UPI0009C18AD5|nr:ankyrin repeat domain-containing protein 1-like isoform X4 [Amborella trichopoda]|eukprot:XP_020519515.1 ankyrin repeat domain-containing protein 1-like isoform X4 [Amborella trichopoda]
MAVPRRMNGVREEAVPRRMNGVHDLTDDSRAFWNGAELGDVDQLRHALVMVQRNMQGHSRFMSHGVGHLEAYNLDGSIDVPLEGGYTALHLTCMLGFLPCVQLLLERGANLEVASGLLRMFPLHSACKGGSTEVVEFLINTVPYSEVVKRILNTGDKDGDTPLHLAALGGHLELVPLLVREGASLTAANVEGMV